jgi:hypothetical protein
MSNILDFDMPKCEMASENIKETKLSFSIDKNQTTQQLDLFSCIRKIQLLDKKTGKWMCQKTIDKSDNIIENEFVITEHEDFIEYEFYLFKCFNYFFETITDIEGYAKIPDTTVRIILKDLKH